MVKNEVQYGLRIHLKNQIPVAHMLNWIKGKRWEELVINNGVEEKISGIS